MIAENNKLLAIQMMLGIVYLLIVPVLVLFLSGDWLWVEGWIFGIWLIVISGVTLTYLVQKDPELVGRPAVPVAVTRGLPSVPSPTMPDRQ